MGRLLFLNRVYWPREAATAQLLHDVATALAQRGMPVHIVTSGPPEPRDRDVGPGIHVVRLGAGRATSSSLARRGWSDLRFLFHVTAFLQRDLREGDTVVALTDPPLLGVAASAAARDRKVAVWHWCQDLYPEVAMALAPAWARVALRALRPWRDWSWRSAQGCVVPGDDLARVVAARGVAAAKIHRLPNWAPAGVTACDGRPLRREWGIDGRFVIAYSGNLGRVHALAPLLDVAEHLRARPDIVFLFIGNGPQRRALEATARERKLDLVHFLPPQPRARLAESLSAANVHLVTLRRGCEGTVWPSKFYGALTVHRPVLYVGPEGTELDRTIRTHRLGGSFRPESPEAIAGWIRQLADDSQRQKQLQTDVTRYAATLPGATAAADFWAAAHAAPVARAAV